MRKSLVWYGPLVIVAGLVAGQAPAWWVKGHGTLAEAAASRLPEGMPAFFRAGGKQLAHLAGEPDRWKNREARHLYAAEAMNHYLDLEDFPYQAWPVDRTKAVAQMLRDGKQPDRVGTLPYALMEHFDRLSCAFYDYREDPGNEAVRMKTLVYAGVLAHFTGDTAMPLHTTRDYDGRRQPDGSILQKGIHAKIDAFPEKNHFTPEEVCRGLEARAIDDVWTHVRKTIEESYQHIDRCYELDKQGAFDRPTAESRAFILERCRVGAQFTMDLWYSAWLRSAKLPPHY